MKFSKQGSVVMFAWVAMLSAACGKQENPGGGLQALTGSSWNGTFTPKNLTAGAVQKVSMYLGSDRQFSLQVANSSSLSMIKGSFTEYPRNKVLVMDFTHSEFDLLGKSGSSYEYSYELADNELSMSGANGRYLLIRDADSQSDADGTANKAYEGDWNCANRSNNLALNLDTKRFRGRREESGRKTLYFEGEIIPAPYESKDKVIIKVGLKVESASINTFAGQTLQLNVTQKGKGVIFAIDDKEKPVSDSQLSCKQ